MTHPNLIAVRSLDEVRLILRRKGIKLTRNGVHVIERRALRKMRARLLALGVEL